MKRSGKQHRYIPQQERMLRAALYNDSIPDEEQLVTPEERQGEARTGREVWSGCSEDQEW